MRAVYSPKHFDAPRSLGAIDFGSHKLRKRSLAGLLERLTLDAAESDYLFYSPVGSFMHQGGSYRLARYVFLGPAAGDEPIRLGIFAGMHGDEPAGSQAVVEFLSRLEHEPERARGYQIFAYPVCNPSGFEDDTHHSRARHDLNHEFWQGSRQPEVYYLERELGVINFHGVISLHAADLDGMDGHARSATIRESLVEPALAATREILPRATPQSPTLCPAAEAIGRKCREGMLVNRTELTSAPFEIVLEAPRHAPLPTQVEAGVAALDSVLAEYRPFLATQQDI